MRLTLAACLLFAVAGCPAVRPASPRPAPAPDAGPRVQKVREELQVTPLEVVFSGVRGEGSTEESVAIKNTGGVPVQVSALAVVGDEGTPFRIKARPDLPITLVPSAQVAVTVAFEPSKDSRLGVHRAMLKVLLGPAREEGPPVDLSGLVLGGRRGEKEPPLLQVLEALGFSVDLPAALRLGTDPAPLGEEVTVARFRRAGKGSVAIYPVARFGGNERVPYGSYGGEAAPELRPLGTVAADQDQKLNPELEPDAITTFDPGEGSFGLFLRLGRRYAYTEDRMNTGAVRHAARIFPIKNRLHARIPDAYVVAFESSGDSDYQDVVFVVWNVALAGSE